MVLADSWRITRSRNTCSGCGVEFRQSQSFFSGLKEDGAEMVRQDFCSACWDQRADEEFFCFWRSRRAQAEQKPVVNTELMLEFFDRLDNLDNANKGVFRFVLALYLVRRKEFKLLEISRAGGVERLVFQNRRTNERVVVENPGLDEQQIQDTEEQLTRLLNACL